MYHGETLNESLNSLLNHFSPEEIAEELKKIEYIKCAYCSERANYWRSRYDRVCGLCGAHTCSEHSKFCECFPLDTRTCEGIIICNNCYKIYGIESYEKKLERFNSKLETKFMVDRDKWEGKIRKKNWELLKKCLPNIVLQGFSICLEKM